MVLLAIIYRKCCSTCYTTYSTAFGLRWLYQTSVDIIILRNSGLCNFGVGTFIHWKSIFSIESDCLNFWSHMKPVLFSDSGCHNFTLYGRNDLKRTGIEIISNCSIWNNIFLDIQILVNRPSSKLLFNISLDLYSRVLYIFNIKRKFKKLAVIL